MGFINGERYVITSAFDAMVFDVKRQKNDGAKVLAWKWNGQNHQIWIANSETGKLGILGGSFRLSVAHTIDNVKVLDQSLGSSKVVIWSFYGTSNQLWTALPVPHKYDVFYIQNLGSGLVVRNMGLGSQLECAPLNEHDLSVQWRITPVGNFYSTAM